MRVLLINSVCGIRSTGRICTDIAEEYMAAGHQVRIAYGRETVPAEYQSIAVSVCNKWDTYGNALKARLLDNEGFNCKRRTRTFLKWAEEYDPDLLWLHNLHGYYINVEMLFDWIKSRPQMEVRWTLHDCWAFTGHCSHFSYVNCDRWKTCCEKCVQIEQYPKAYKDRSRENYVRKKKAFCGVKNLTLIVPSKWLKKNVEKSFLKEYPIEVRYNTVDETVFKRTESDFRQKHNLEGKTIVLGVASIWTERKGLSDFVELRAMLDETYAIVLVGLTDKQAQSLPPDIICIARTNSKQELAEIYTAADVFINPSREETFGLTTLEALSCGTPAIVYKNTACEEVINHYGNGVAVETAVSALSDAIEAVLDGRRNA